MFSVEQTEPKVSIINMREEINKIEIEKTIKINKTKSWFFEKVEKTCGQTHQEEVIKTQINKIRNEKG